MQIEFIKSKELIDLSRVVRHGDRLVSPADAPEELLRAYVANGIAKEIETNKKPTESKTTPEVNHHVS